MLSRPICCRGLPRASIQVRLSPCKENALGRILARFLVFRTPGGFMRDLWKYHGSGLFKRVPLGENRVDQLGAACAALESKFDVNYEPPIPKRHRRLFWPLDSGISNNKFAHRIDGIKKSFLWVYRAFLTYYSISNSKIQFNKPFLLSICTCYKKKRRKRNLFLTMRRNRRYPWYFQLLI